jgi:hypothetical protein
MECFAVLGSGLIKLRHLPNGDVALIYTGSGLVEEVIQEICKDDRCYRDRALRHWVIRSHFLEAAIADLATRATRLDL